MTPGIHPSNVKMILRKKLAMRPVISTASGGNNCSYNFSIPSGVFVDLHYLPICTYNLRSNTGIISGPYVAGLPSADPQQFLTISRTVTELTATYHNGGGSGTQETLTNLGCILVHN